MRALQAMKSTTSRNLRSGRGKGLDYTKIYWKKKEKDCIQIDRKFVRSVIEE